MSKRAKITLTTAALMLISTGAWAQNNAAGPNAPYTASETYDGQTYNNGGSNMNQSGSGAMNGNAMDGDAMNRGTMDRGMLNDTARSPSAIEPQAGNAGAYISRNPQSLSAGDVRSVQESLRARGYNIAADGIWGNQSASALRNFQQNSGIANMGLLDADTQAALNLSLGASGNQ